MLKTLLIIVLKSYLSIKIIRMKVLKIFYLILILKYITKKNDINKPTILKKISNISNPFDVKY